MQIYANSTSTCVRVLKHMPVFVYMYLRLYTLMQTQSAGEGGVCVCVRAHMLSTGQHRDFYIDVICMFMSCSLERVLLCVCVCACSPYVCHKDRE